MKVEVAFKGVDSCGAPDPEDVRHAALMERLDKIQASLDRFVSVFEVVNDHRPYRMILRVGAPTQES